MSLPKLPFELVCYVVQHLDLSDAFSLSSSCRRFFHGITKLVLEVSCSFRANRTGIILLILWLA